MFFEIFYQGPMLWFKKKSPKNWRKIVVFDSKQSYIIILMQKFGRNIGFWEKRHFLQKIVKNRRKLGS
jgi:hypothetical protein